MSKFLLTVEVDPPLGWKLSLLTEPGRHPRFELTRDPSHAATEGHGHVFPRADGAVAKCGGPKICSECAKDQATEDARLFGNGWLRVGAIPIHGPHKNRGEAVKERPILMSAPMVRAILDPRKTQTRRIVKPQPPEWCTEFGYTCFTPKGHISGRGKFEDNVGEKYIRCPYGVHGDELYVKETWRVSKQWDHLAPRDLPFDRGMTIMYGAGGSRAHNENGVYVNDNSYPPTLPDWAGKTRVSIHMPRAASRITLRITDVRVERLQDISEEDAWNEGVQDWMGKETPWKGVLAPTSVHAYAALWESINGRGSWDANPWTWAVSFERVK